jgi:hypothetical protein
MPSSLKKNPDFIVTRYDDIQIPLYFLNIRKDIDAEGLCYHPLEEGASILVDKKLGKKRKLNVIIEEITHAFFYDEPEYKVRKFSSELGRIIYNRYIKANAEERD